MSKPRVSLIVALAEKDRAIGKDNGLLWNIPEDLKHFKEITLGHPIIMGENTYHSIGRPLPGRENIVLTKDVNLELPGCTVVYSIEDALEQAKVKDEEEVFVIGGGSVYTQMLPYVERIYMTKVEGDFEADIFFPEYDAFSEIISEEAHDNGQYRFTFTILEKAKV
ncbi:MAG: dihydrofolate reductase [Patescibacteria group bacterium]